ncbi:MAG: helix-turn-helix domain-containing protein [Planctomycetota bacterium]
MTPLATQPVFTPKQVARALGVSESSVKRWCDSGQIRAGKTVGGHRKLPISSIVAWIRETGHEVVDPVALGLAATPQRRRPEQSIDDLFASLAAGDEAAARSLVLGFYQRGSEIAELGDLLISPAFKQIGDGWEQGEISVHQERRACEIMLAVLHELRRWLPPAPADAPLAMTATPLRDFAQTPIRLVEVLLLAAGWRTEMVGAGLPLEEIQQAVAARKPQLLCLSVTHLKDVGEYVDLHNRLVTTLDRDTRIVVGGGALTAEQAGALRCDLFAPDLNCFAEWLAAHPVTDHPHGGAG